jgi:hypothetical protein
MRFAPIAALLCAAFLALAGTAAANTFTVTTTDDDVGTCDPGDCSVREALAAADANPGEDTVSIPAGHYVLTQGELFTDALDTLNVVGHSARDTVLDGAGASRVLDAFDGTINMSHLTITGGVAPGDDPKAPGEGGGIYFDGSVLTLDHLAVVGNRALGQSGFGGQGGGIFADEAMTITNSLIAGNTADGTGSDFSGGQGGGIFGNESLTLTNVTVSNNVATPALPNATFPHSQGGGIFVNELGTTFTHVTISGNQASGEDAGGGVFINDDTKFVNSLVAGNTVDGAPQNCVLNDVVTELGHNLQGTGDCGFAAAGDITADPLLAALGNNGGETDTAALQSGSPAIDSAAADVCAPTDQRDLPRPQFAGCDIGAFEVQPAAATPPPSTPVATADTTRPRVTVAGVRASCVSSGRLSVRVRATDASGIKATRVTLDGKRIHTRNKTRFTLRINVRKLKAGRHVLRIVTTDGAGNRTSTRRTVTRCAKRAAKPKRQVAPRFTG